MKKLQSGFTLIELLITVVILAILLVFATSLVFGGIDCKNQKMGWIMRAKVGAAIGDIGSTKLDLDMYELNHDSLPDSTELLALLGVDRFGNPYQFLDHSTVNGEGPKRKYKSLVPVNSQYDLYSMGPDGKTATPMTSQPGEDDIILANDGGYIGVACFYGGYTK